jgi:hypothetical protein
MNKHGYVWAVITILNQQAVHADGPYTTRKTALSVKQMLDQNESINDLGEPLKYKVVKLTYLIPPEEFARFMDARISAGQVTENSP